MKVSDVLMAFLVKYKAVTLEAWHSTGWDLVDKAFRKALDKRHIVRLYLN
jgi:hypothetical protein